MRMAWALARAVWRPFDAAEMAARARSRAEGLAGREGERWERVDWQRSGERVAQQAWRIAGEAVGAASTLGLGMGACLWC